MGRPLNGCGQISHLAYRAHLWCRSSAALSTMTRLVFAVPEFKTKSTASSWLLSAFRLQPATMNPVDWRCAFPLSDRCL